ncbi:MAG: STN domain-containing protein, partial [Tannerellaceae bacterium]|nr:STN domain-containing protein [Tannerellaceae bacterium]
PIVPGLTIFFKIMRISTFLLFLFICTLNAEVNSQNSLFTIRKNNVELENIISEIEKQSYYLFIYNKDVNVNQKTSVNISGLPLPDALHTIFDKMDIGYEIDGSYILLSVQEKKK